MGLLSNEPTRLQLPDLKLVGPCTFADFFSSNLLTLFAETWERFNKLKHTIAKPANGQRTFGLQLYPPDFPADCRWYYSACLEVDDLNSPQPSGTMARFIPAAEYLRFTVAGPVTEIGPAFRFIYDEWLPNSGVKLAGYYDLEMYDARFTGPCDPKSEMDILLPLA